MSRTLTLNYGVYAACIPNPEEQANHDTESQSLYGVRVGVVMGAT